jgi:tRNA(Ile)-lysidine synthase
MQSQFVDYIRHHNLATDQDRILLGVSGGIDSMAMLHLFMRSGFSIAVAHCNFGLRGEESDGDEMLVKRTCLLNGMNCHSVRFDTLEFARENKLSIQVAARQLRYEYFDKLCEEHKYTRVAIAHNLDDVAETMLINLTRGTGIKGLTGIKPQNGKIIRPLLFAKRSEIEKYATEHGIAYRTDSSNLSVKYKRNFIRHKILPELESLNPSAKESIASTARHMQEAWSFIEGNLKAIRARVLLERNDEILFSINELRATVGGKLLLMEELTGYGFSPRTIDQVYALIDAQPGAHISSNTHAVTRDREYLILSPLRLNPEEAISIGCSCQRIEHPVSLQFEQLPNEPSFAIPRDKDTAALDFDMLQFPLTLRAWQDGDRFVPFGMDKLKKISDFLIDEKIPLTEKKRVKVLLSGNNIIWVVGIRIDNRYRITNKTTRIWLIRSIAEPKKL